MAYGLTTTKTNDSNNSNHDNNNHWRQQPVELRKLYKSDAAAAITRTATIIVTQFDNVHINWKVRATKKGKKHWEEEYWGHDGARRDQTGRCEPGKRLRSNIGIKKNNTKQWWLHTVVCLCSRTTWRLGPRFVFTGCTDSFVRPSYWYAMAVPVHTR